MKTYYKPGAWNAICDVCGFQHKSDQLTKRWDGLMVCSKDFETRHPQDLLKVPREQGTVAWSRPSPTNVFIGVSYPITTEFSDTAFILTETGLPILTEN